MTGFLNPKSSGKKKITGHYLHDSRSTPIGHGIFHPVSAVSLFILKQFFAEVINPFRAPEPLPIPNPSSFVPKNGFPVEKGLLS